MKVTIKPRSAKLSKRFPLTVDLASPNATVGELKRSIQSQAKIGYYRQRITTGDKKVLDQDGQSLAAAGVKDGDVLEIKDLGPQISWRVVFLTEYFGPLFIHPFFFYAQKLVYRQTFEHSKMQKIAFALVMLHYLKRELETVLCIFVHRFASATMPIFNLFKNSGHYWGLSGLVLAIPLYAPWNSASALAGTIRSNDRYLYSLVGLWAYGEISNFITHLNLRSLRPAGTKTRAIPKGYGFGLLSCPNYFFEIVAWAAFTALTLDYASGLFLAVAVGQMVPWALKKHRRYKKEFGKEYPRGRKAMFPFLI